MIVLLYCTVWCICIVFPESCWFLELQSYSLTLCALFKQTTVGANLMTAIFAIPLRGPVFCFQWLLGPEIVRLTIQNWYSQFLTLLLKGLKTKLYFVYAQYCNIIASLTLWGLSQQVNMTPPQSQVLMPKIGDKKKLFVCLFFAKHVNILLCFSGLMIW